LEGLYDYWLETLLGAVGECGGIENERVEGVWRRVLAGAIHVMKSGV
jgi:hypothetical protein